MQTTKRPRDAGLTDDGVNANDEFSSAGPPTPSSTDARSPAKRIHLDHEAPPSTSAPTSTSPPAIRCSLPPHDDLVFPSAEAYEIHYVQNHLHRCQECGRNFPSEHYVGLHITEHHDPIAELQRERGERTYACFVEDCDRKCSNPHKRRRHLIDKHGFPKLYDFFVVNNGIDRRTSMLRTPGPNMKPTYRTAWHEGDLQSTRARPDDTGLPHNPPADTLVELTRSMSALKFIPRNVRFGRGGSKTFTR